MVLLQKLSSKIGHLFDCDHNCVSIGIAIELDLGYAPRNFLTD